MKWLTAIVSLVVLTYGAGAPWDEKPIRVSGVASLEVFPGPPNYESIQDGDAREEAWILTTSQNERFHLVILGDGKEKFATLRHSLGKKLRVDGTVWGAHTSHHRTPFLITLRSIEKEPNSERAAAP
jgi:hypothetical protein